MKAAQETLLQALRREAEAQRLLLAGDADAAAPLLREVASLYRRSWEEAPPRAYGRLVGMMKAAVLAGNGVEEARYARTQVGEAAGSPAAAYALALAALVTGDDDSARREAGVMAGGEPGFRRAAASIDALADADADRYATALAAVVADFEAREEHLTGVAIADTALVLERLAERRGLAAHVVSPLMPQR